MAAADPLSAFEVAPIKPAAPAAPLQTMYPPPSAPDDTGIKGSVSFTDNVDPLSAFAVAPIGGAAKPTARMAAAVPGPNGLLWNKTGGFDPKTGELVIAGKPPQEIAPSQTRAALSSFPDVPIVGPALISGATQAGAWLRNLLTGQPADQIVSAEQGANATSQAAYPKTAFVANTIGDMAALTPAMMAAPAAFGAAEGAPLVANALTGAATGAGIGAADRVARNLPTVANALQRPGGPDWASVASTVGPGAVGGFLGGAAGPVVGAGLGKVLGTASNLWNRTTPGAANVANMLRTAGMTPMQAEAELATNPRLVLADLTPGMSDEAGALAAQGGTPTEVLKAAMKARGASADDQIQQLAVANLGPRPDPTMAKEAILKSAQNASSPFYSAMRANKTPMDVTPILNDINSRLQSVPHEGGTEKLLTKVRGYLTDQKVTTPGTPGSKPTTLTVPRDDPDTLLQARHELDGVIQGLEKNGSIDGTSAGRDTWRVANNLRGQLDAVLKSDPNIAAGDAAYASRIVAKDDLDNGTNIFKTPIADFQRSVAAASADPARIQAMQQGALATLHDGLNGVAGDYAKARNLFAKGTDNRTKLDALFPGGAGKFLDVLGDEIRMRGTEGNVAAGSQTASRQAIGQKYGAKSGGTDIGPAAPLVGEALGGGVGAAGLTAGKMILGNLRNAFTEAGRQRLMEETARGLASTGPEQQQFMGQVTRAFRAHPITHGLVSGSPYATNLLSRPLAQVGANRLYPPAQ
jgi:hypothetical protein